MKHLILLILIGLIWSACEENHLTEENDFINVASSAILEMPTSSSTAGEWMAYLLQESPNEDTVEYADGSWTYYVYREETSGWDLHHVTRDYSGDTHREMFWRQPTGTSFAYFGVDSKALFDFPGAGCKSASGDIDCGGLTHYQDISDAGLLHVRFKQRQGNVGMSDSGARVLLDYFFEEIFIDMPLTGHWAQGFSGGGGTVTFLLEDLDTKNTIAFDGGVVICASPTSERIEARSLVNTIRDHDIVVLFHANDGEQAAYLRRAQNMGAEFVASRESGAPYAYGYPMIRDFDSHNASIRYPNYTINHDEYFDNYTTQAGEEVTVGWKSVIADGMGTLEARFALRARADAGLAPIGSDVINENMIEVGDSISFDPASLIAQEQLMGLNIEVLRGSVSYSFDEKEGFARMKSLHNTAGATIKIMASSDYPVDAQFEIKTVLTSLVSLPRKRNLSHDGVLITFPCDNDLDQTISFQNEGQFLKVDDDCFSNSHQMLIKEIIVTRRAPLL